jgi:hypothetical protein
MRHAEHKEGALEADATAHVIGVSGRLREWLDLEGRVQNLRSIDVWLATDVPEVRETARILASTGGFTEPRVLPVEVCEDVEHVLGAYDPDAQAFDKLVGWLVSPTPTSKLLVGNDPLIGWLANRLRLADRLRGVGRHADVAVDRGELVCLRIDGRAAEHPDKASWKLIWTISADGPTTTEAILVKVRSKATIATALGTVIVGLTTFLLQNAVKEGCTGFQWLAFAAFFASAYFYFATLFLYDTLQMPSRYWASRFPTSRKWWRGRPTLARPPTSTARVLQVAMVQIWKRVFTLATVLGAVGVVLLAMSATPSGAAFDPNVEPWLIALTIAIVAGTCGLWVFLNRPDLGTTD